MRTRPLLLVLLAVLALAACGGDDPIAGVRVRLLTSAADGPIEGDLKLQAVDDGVGRLWDTRALGEGVYVAPGAPAGKYRPLTTAGWGMLWTGRKGSSAPLLRGAAYPAATVRMGKPHSLYVASGLPGQWTLSDTWAAEWKRAVDGEAAFQPAALKVEAQGEGIVALRFPPDVWSFGNIVRILGLMSDGTVTGMESYQLRDRERQELPRMALILAAVQAPLTVHLVPPPGVDKVPDGTPVRVTLLGVALPHTYEGLSRDGRVRFDAIAALGHGLRVELPRSGPAAVFSLDPETWRLRQALHVVAVDPEALADIELVEMGGGYTEARVCYRGGSEFGRISFERTPGPPDAVQRAVRVHTHPGWQEWWLKTADGDWVHVPLEVDPPPFEVRYDAGRPDGAGVRIRGKVRGGRAGHRVEFRQVFEALRFGGDEALPARKLGGEGFVAAISAHGGYEAHLPPGRYEIRVVGPTGGSSVPKMLTFDPGAEVRFDLEAR